MKRARHLPLDPIADDPARRLRNALLAIMRTHPKPLLWIRDNLPPDATECLMPWRLLMVESFARYMVLKSYTFFHREQISGLVFQSTWYFNDNGHLPPG